MLGWVITFLVIRLKMKNPATYKMASGIINNATKYCYLGIE